MDSCRRVCRYSWQDFLCASAADIEKSLRWAENRTKSMVHLSGDALRAALEYECSLWDADVDEVLAVALESRQTRSLNPAECRRLTEYKALCKSKGHSLSNLVAYVGQEPGPHPQMSFGPCMHTLIKSSSIVWADGEACRPMDPVEMLCCQGFVSHTSLGDGFMTSSFLRDRPRDRKAVISQAGNSMPVPMVGIALLYAVIAVDRKPLLELPAHLVRLSRLHARSASA